MIDDIFVQTLISALDTETKFRNQEGFYPYSYYNMIYLRSQGAVGPVATFSFWKSKDRFVKKGEKAYKIKAPLIFTKKVKTVDNFDEETIKICGGFNAKPSVFSYGQTTGKEISQIEDNPNYNWSSKKCKEKLGLHDENIFSDLVEESSVKDFLTKAAESLIQEKYKISKKKIFTKICAILAIKELGLKQFSYNKEKVKSQIKTMDKDTIKHIVDIVGKIIEYGR